MTENPHGAPRPAPTGRPGRETLPPAPHAADAYVVDWAPLPPDAPSAIERVYQSFRTHEIAESDTLAAYRRLASTTSDPVVRLVMGLVIEDEERHHTLMRRIAATLHDKLYWTTSAAALPSERPRAAATTEDRAAVAHFVEQERAGVRHLHALAHDRALDDDGLCATLIESIAADSEKHAHLLRYVLQRLAAATSGAL